MHRDINAILGSLIKELQDACEWRRHPDFTNIK
jgi:hypothetical protein